MADHGRNADEACRILSDTHVLSSNPDLCCNTPSRKHAISMEEENSMRFYGCELIQHAVIQLQLSTATCATAQILFHRFYFRQSMRKYSVERLAPACLYLAAKVEEQPQPISNILEVFHHMLCARRLKPHVSLSELPDAVVGEQRADLTKTESLLLTQLGFIVHMELPYKFLCAYLDFLGLRSQRVLAQRAWNYANDVFRSDACVRFDAPTLACACIHLAAADTSIPLPFDPPWWLVFDVSDAGIACVTVILQQLLDAPRAFNVLEPPPSPVSHESKNNSEVPVFERSHAGTFQENANDGSSIGAEGRRDDSRNAAHGERSGGMGDCREQARRGEHNNDFARRSDHHDDRSDASDRRWRHHREEQHGGSAHRGSHSHDDRRDYDRDVRRDGGRDDARRGDRTCHRARDDSRERQRDLHREGRSSRSGGRSDDRLNASLDRGEPLRDDRHEQRTSQDAPSLSDALDSLDPVSHNVARHSNSGENSHGVGDMVPKTGRRSGRWDES